MCLKNIMTEEEKDQTILNQKLDFIVENLIISKVVDLIFTRKDLCHSLLGFLGNLVSYSHDLLEDQLYKSGYFIKRKSTEMRT